MLGLKALEMLAFQAARGHTQARIAERTAQRQAERGGRVHGYVGVVARELVGDSAPRLLGRLHGQAADDELGRLGRRIGMLVREQADQIAILRVGRVRLKFHAQNVDVAEAKQRRHG